MYSVQYMIVVKNGVVVVTVVIEYESVPQLSHSFENWRNFNNNKPNMYSNLKISYYVTFQTNSLNLVLYFVKRWLNSLEIVQQSKNPHNEWSHVWQIYYRHENAWQAVKYIHLCELGPIKIIYPVEFVMECYPLLESMNEKPLSSMSFEEVFHAFNHKDL